MTLAAPAIIDVRTPDRKAALPSFLRGIGIRQVRLVCGLVMFSYIFSHFFNHALGNLSYDTMEAWLRFHVWWWRTPVVNLTLYADGHAHTNRGRGSWSRSTNERPHDQRADFADQPAERADQIRHPKQFERKIPGLTGQQH
jgi:hypothetical protein